MKRYAALGLALLATACATLKVGSDVYAARYELALAQVTRPQSTKQQWGSRDSISLGDSSKYYYEDRLVTMWMLPGSDRINFGIRNNTDHTIKLIWDEVSFIDYDGELAKVMHNGTRYIDRDASRPPTVIPARQRLIDFVVPNNRVWYSSGSGWDVANLILPSRKRIARGSPRGTQFSASDTLAAFRRAVEEMRGKRIGLVLPLEIEGVKNEYTLWFEIRDAEVIAPATQAVAHSR